MIHITDLDADLDTDLERIRIRHRIPGLMAKEEEKIAFCTGIQIHNTVNVCCPQHFSATGSTMLFASYQDITIF
jgi:hypothetical protein